MGDKKSIERVLASLEEYFDLKRDIGSIEEPNIFAAKERAGRALNEYIQYRFDDLLFEDRKKASTITTKVHVPDVSSVKFTWDDVVALLDALNSPPHPLKELDDRELRERWMRIYTEWYQVKRPLAMNTISPVLGLDLDLENDESLKKK